MLTSLAGYALNAGDVPRPVAGGGHPVLVPTQNFQTADGWVSFFVGNDPMWRRARAALEVPELEDPRFETVAGRALHKEEVLRLVGARLRRDSTEHWVARLEAAGVPCGPPDPARRRVGLDAGPDLGRVGQRGQHDPGVCQAAPCVRRHLGLGPLHHACKLGFGDADRYCLTA